LKTICIVDSNKDNARLLKEILTFRGYHVIINNNGKNAYDLIVQEQPDLILTEIHVPGMNGYKVTRKIKRNPQTSHIPVVAVTACAFRGDRKKVMRSGFDEYISKPINTLELPKVIERLIGPSYGHYRLGRSTADLMGQSVERTPINPDYGHNPTTTSNS